jgi:hypothetical protein
MSNSTTPPYTPQYAAEYRGNVSMSFAASFVVINIFVVSLRLYATRLRMHKWDLEDLLAVLSLVFNLAACAIVISK